MKSNCLFFFFQWLLDKNCEIIDRPLLSFKNLMFTMHSLKYLAVGGGLYFFIQLNQPVVL